ncbi:MAG: hypothetical protein UR98_C0001G0082 [Parcubacteria group bacterium GW2011_GWA1_36_12]|nr:MAG: hypothetical protein UR98_C0001G0082 [Parcubacteria group bacterium GW2011_GWA1_36_12]
MKSLEKKLLVANFLLYFFLAIFSYAYVDLNLTLSQNKFVLSFVNFLQALGYYHRSAATFIYLLFLITAFSFFLFNLWLFYKKQLSLSYLKFATLLSTFILIFAYTFLSSDLFNYIFDAKIIIKYHANPYTHRPLDFPTDDWLRFMRWIHRYSPYGPLWLGYTLIPATLGFGKFIFNLITFKVFISIFHLINALLIYRILNKIRPRATLFGTAFYALNPTLLLEGVANAHNDVVLATFLILPIYLLTIRKTTLSYLTLFAGTLIKYIPILNLPWLIWYTFGRSKNVQFLILLNLITMAIFTYFFSSFKISVPFVSSGATQVQFQPWYLFWTLPLVSLVSSPVLVLTSTTLAFGASLRYLPYLFYGDWSHSGTQLFMQSITFLPAVVVLIGVSIKTFRNKST